MQVTQFIIIIIYLVDLWECQMVPYIIHGENATIRKFPYCAFLHTKCVDDYGDEQSYMCGSSIINQYLTLTAAHCTAACIDTSIMTISVGAETHKGAISTVLSFLSHNKYDQVKIVNDISLVRLKTPLTFSATVSRVALMAHPPYEEEAIVAGWGEYDDQYHKYPKTLQYTTQFVKNRELCAQLLKKHHLKDGTFCASNHDGYPSKGDSGSALVVRNYIQIGLVSNKLKKPTEYNRNVVVYTDTGFHYEWIKTSAKKIMCE